MPPRKAASNTAGDPDQAPAIKQRVYTTTACQRCRKKRAKCDGVKPACGRCLAEGLGQICEYNLEQDKRKPPSQAFIQGLRDRIAELEERLEWLTGKVADGNTALQGGIHSQDSDYSHVVSPGESSSEDSEDAKLALRLEAQLVVTDDGVPRSLGPTSPFQHRGSPPKSNLYAPLHVESSLQCTLETTSLARTDFIPFNLPAGLHHALLSSALAWQMPFMDWVESTHFLRDMVNADESATSSWSPTLHLAMLGIGSRYIKKELIAAGIDPNRLEASLVMAAKQRLILVEMEKSTLATIRGIICIAAIINSNGDNRQGWLLLGMAMRMSEDSGLHLDSSRLVNSGEMTQADATARNKAFWTLFSIDQSWSVWLGRPSNPLPGKQVPLPEIDVEAEYSAWDPPGRASQVSYRSSSFRELAKLSLLIQSVMNTIYVRDRLSSTGKHTRTSLDLELFEWYNQLPAHLRVTTSGLSPSPPHVFGLHLQWHTAVIVLHRPAFFDSDDQPSSSGGSTSSSQDKCITAAKAILSIARQYDQVYTLERPNQTFSLNFWIAGTILLLVAAQRPTDRTAQKNLTRIIDDLKLAGSVWIECTECADVLTKLHASINKPEEPAEQMDTDTLFGMLQMDTAAFPSTFTWPLG